MAAFAQSVSLVYPFEPSVSVLYCPQLFDNDFPLFKDGEHVRCNCCYVSPVTTHGQRRRQRRIRIVSLRPPQNLNSLTAKALVPDAETSLHFGIIGERRFENVGDDAEVCCYPMPRLAASGLLRQLPSTIL